MIIQHWIKCGMLCCSWLWGFIGLLFAVPLTAFVKLIADSRLWVASSQYHVATGV
jgi:predicted PurR-regulated permease PerM